MTHQKGDIFTDAASFCAFDKRITLEDFLLQFLNLSLDPDLGC